MVMVSTWRPTACVQDASENKLLVTQHGLEALQTGPELAHVNIVKEPGLSGSAWHDRGLVVVVPPELQDDEEE